MYLTTYTYSYIGMLIQQCFFFCKFWDSQSEMVKELVGPKMFRRIVKIFNLRLDEKPYEPLSESMSLEPSEMFYAAMEGGEVGASFLNNSIQQ